MPRRSARRPILGRHAAASDRWYRRKRSAGHFESIYRYNYKRSLAQHDNTERTFALNDEAAVVMCDYGKAERPQIPFPYFAEARTGFEYTAAALMMRWGMVEQGVEIVARCAGALRRRKAQSVG